MKEQAGAEAHYRREQPAQRRASVPTLVVEYSSAAKASRRGLPEGLISEPIQLEINGQRRSVSADPETPLLWVLREELGLTGTKYGCGEGQCGACTVLIAGNPRRSCQVLLRAAAGKAVTTIEGLEQNGKLHPLQQAFLDAGAFQCAYCTPGMIVTSVALLRQFPSPSPQQIAEFLDGNICRCGTYPRILEAVARAADAMKGQPR
jgi:aerobic-type carbon monoxide dehydrogenase small subunit (CoxS/CutS family)